MTNTKKARKNVYEIITERILAKLEEGTVPWHKPWTGAGNEGRAANLISGKAYRGINVLLTASAGFSSRYWVTFKQAQKLGGSVRKGEKGTPIVFWSFIEKKGAKAGDKKIPLLRYYTCFNVEQCDGIEHKRLTETAPAPVSEFDASEEAEMIVKGYANGPTINHGGGCACYSPPRDSVSVPKREDFESAAAYYSTLFHELTHSTGHTSRLARSGVTESTLFGSHEYSREELVAEMGASFLRGMAGIDDTAALDNSAAYLANWMTVIKDDPRLIVIAAAQAQKASDHILGITWDDAPKAD